MRGFRLDPTSHDLYLDASGDLDTVDDDEATAQEIKTRLLFLKGEAFTDLREGTPWFQEVLIKGVDMARVRAIVRKVIASVPGVLDVVHVGAELDRATRNATITWEVRNATGRVISSDDFPPLIVAGPDRR